MLNDLTSFFTLATRFRQSNILIQKIILNDALPGLASETKSVRLKVAINRFIQENHHASTDQASNS
jgi:hypothetical protein